MDLTFYSLNTIFKFISLKKKKKDIVNKWTKHCTQRISLLFFVFLDGLKAPSSSMASFSHYPNETKC